jgi:hypothetical protein
MTVFKSDVMRRCYYHIGWAMREAARRAREDPSPSPTSALCIYAGTSLVYQEIHALTLVACRAALKGIEQIPYTPRDDVAGYLHAVLDED